MSLSNERAPRPPSARSGERGNRLIEARKRARAGRVHSRLVILNIGRFKHAAQRQQAVHGRGREPGLDRRGAGGDGDRFERREIDARRSRRPFALRGQGGEAGPPRQRLGEPRTRLGFRPIEGRGHAQADVEALGVDGLELERPAPRAAAAGGAGKSGHAAHRHRLNAFRGSDRVRSYDDTFVARFGSY